MDGSRLVRPFSNVLRFLGNPTSTSKQLGTVNGRCPITLELLSGSEFSGSEFSGGSVGSHCGRKDGV